MAALLWSVSPFTRYQVREHEEGDFTTCRGPAPEHISDKPLPVKQSYYRNRRPISKEAFDAVLKLEVGSISSLQPLQYQFPSKDNPQNMKIVQIWGKDYLALNRVKTALWLAAGIGTAAYFFPRKTAVCALSAAVGLIANSFYFRKALA